MARLAVWVALACGFGRVEGGEDEEIAGAVLCLARPSLRTAALAAAVVGAVFVGFAALAELWPTPALFLALAMIAGGVIFLARLVYVVARSWEPRKQLHKARPAGAWHLHSFASLRSGAGAGATLLDRVCDELEVAGRVAYLDTCEGLVDYYRRFGFEAVATPTMTRHARPVTKVRMVRILKGADHQGGPTARGSSAVEPQPGDL